MAKLISIFKRQGNSAAVTMKIEIGDEVFASEDVVFGFENLPQLVGQTGIIIQEHPIQRSYLRLLIAFPNTRVWCSAIITQEMRTAFLDNNLEYWPYG